MNSVRHITNIRHLRIIFAAAFLCVMLVEWGSHSLAFAHGAQPEGMVAVSSEGGHNEDLCKTMVHSGDGRRQSQLPGIGHDLIQHNLFMASGARLIRRSFADTTSGISREDAHRLFRPIDPPFQPPENS